MEVDYWSACDEKIPAAFKMAKEDKFHDAIDSLLALEKQTRTGSDMPSTGRVLVAIVQICFEAKNWTALNEHISLLAKRRSQLKGAVVKMIQECVSYVDKTPNKEIKVKLIETLRAVTEGKIYVEVERARLTHILAKMKEDEGDVTEAANIIQELQVETYGTMEKKEKVTLILEQMRLCLEKKDYIRTQIISKKINTKFFDDKKEEIQELKLKYYKLMIESDQHDGSYLATCKHYRAILNTPCIQNDVKQRHEVLQNVVLYLILAPYDNEQSDLTHHVLEDKLLNEIPLYKGLLQLFTNPDLIKWTGLCEHYEGELFKTCVFNKNTEAGQKSFQTLKHRVVEHNIRVMAKYYTRITLKRMCDLLGLPINETEEFLCSMVTNKTISAKIDRPAGIINFARNKDPSEILNEWSANLNELMKLVNNTTHLINKEQMVHQRVAA